MELNEAESRICFGISFQVHAPWYPKDYLQYSRWSRRISKSSIFLVLSLEIFDQAVIYFCDSLGWVLFLLCMFVISLSYFIRFLTLNQAHTQPSLCFDHSTSLRALFCILCRDSSFELDRLPQMTLQTVYFVFITSSLRDQYPWAFEDLCLYCQMMDQLGTYTFRLSMRRFIQALFENINCQMVSRLFLFCEEISWYTEIINILRKYPDIWRKTRFILEKPGLSNCGDFRVPYWYMYLKKTWYLKTYNDAYCSMIFRKQHQI